MIIALTGTNHFELSRRLNKIIGDFIQQNGELALERFDAEEIEAKTIVEAINNLPFLAKSKMVVVRNGQANKDFVESIEQIISSTPEWCELVLYEPKIDRRSNYFKVLKAKTKFEDFPELNARNLPKWLTGEAKNLGGELNFSNANYLVQRVGANQIRLVNELNKLITFSPVISRENIDLLTESAPQSKVFDLLDAAFAGQTAKALKLYEEQRAQKVEPQAILAMIVWQLNLLALAKTGKGRQIQQIAKDSGTGEFPLRKAVGIADKITIKHLKELVNGVYEMDLKSKTKTYELDEAIRTYIAAI